MSVSTLANSRALWNRTLFNLRSDEILAQILDRGSFEDWRCLYALAKSDPELRQRIRHIVEHVPLPQPHFWLALLCYLGENVDVGMRVPGYTDQSV